MISDIFNPHKVLHHHEVMGQIAKGCPTLPVVASIDPSAVCNQDCEWCSGTGYVNKCTAKLDRQLLLRLPIELSRLGIKAAFFTGGGEPLINPHMEDAIVAFANSGIQTGLVTNGTLLDGKVCERAAMFCEWVRISVDASNPDTYHITHKNDKSMFFRVLKNIASLVHYRDMYKSDCIVGASFLVHPINYKEIYPFAEIALDLGVDYVQFKPLLVIKKWFSEDDMSRQIIHYMAKAKDDFECDSFHVAANFGRFQHVKVGFKRPYDLCLGHNLIAIIMATGQMNVCCHQRPRPSYTFGDLHKQSFEEIWFGKEREEAVRNINFAECPSCKYEMYNQYLWAMHRQPLHANFI